MTDATISVNGGPEVPIGSTEAEEEVGKLFEPTEDDREANVLQRLRKTASASFDKAEKAAERAVDAREQAIEDQRALDDFLLLRHMG